jgi:hypothetical protein
MIGAFARMFGSRDRVLTVEETEANAYEVKARSEDGLESVSTTVDQPPAAFVERLPHEGGDVYFAPVLETLRAVLRKARATLPRPSENAEYGVEGQEGG